VVTSFIWGSGGLAYAVQGDLDRDGKADPIVYQRTFVDVVELLGGNIEDILADPDVPPFFLDTFPKDTRRILVVMLGDMTNDGAADMIGYNPENGKWTVIDFENNVTQTFDLGMPGAQAMTGDFDGDGQTDIGQYDGGTFTTRLTVDGSIVTEADVGGDGWVAMIADYTGDGIDDYAAYNPETGEWQYRDSATNAVESISWMGPGLLPMTGDYDKDGKSDIAVYDATSGEWWIRSSLSGSLLQLDPTDLTHTLVLGTMDTMPVNDALTQDVVIDIFNNL
jgi:hypothetical protein